MASAVFRGLEILVGDIGIVVSVQSLVEHPIDVSRVYRSCPLEIQGEVFPANLIELAFSEFDLILDMNCLFVNRVNIDSERKRATLEISDDREVTIIGERR